MSCDWSTKLERYVDGELAAAELAGVEAHLRTCSACASDALSRLQSKRMVQAAGRRFSPRPEFRLKIERSIARSPRPLWIGRWAAALAAAAALALLLIAGGGWLRHSNREQALRELADLHVSALASANPTDVVSSDRHTVKPWFQGKLPFTFNLPELEGSPYKLAGGRLAYFQQSPGAQLFFDLRKHRLSVFFFQDAGGVSALDVLPGTKLSFRIETWAEGGVRCYVVGDAGPSEIRALSELLKRAAGS
jgi:anti-sigma factor RsiW